MDQFIVLIGTLALLGSAVIGGTFYAFSSFVMKALSRLSVAEGVAAMQSINVVVLNASFLGAFVGTAVLSLGAAALAVVGWDRPSAPFLLGAAIFYVVGTFLVTGLCNVPLNNRLAAVPATDPRAQEEWRRYVTRWTAWNHVRTVAAMVATLLYAVALVRDVAA